MIIFQLYYLFGYVMYVYGRHYKQNYGKEKHLKLQLDGDAQIFQKIKNKEKLEEVLKVMKKFIKLQANLQNTKKNH